MKIAEIESSGVNEVHVNANSCHLADPARCLRCPHAKVMAIAGQWVVIVQRCGVMDNEDQARRDPYVYPAEYRDALRSRKAVRSSWLFPIILLLSIGVLIYFLVL